MASEEVPIIFTQGEIVRNNMSEALQQSEETLAVTLDSIADGVISTDLSGHVMRMNRVAQQLTGWSILEAKGRHLKDVFRIVDGDTGEKLKGPYEEVMKADSVVKLAPNTSLISRSGIHYQIEDSAAPIRTTDNKKSSGIVLVFRDVTEKNKLEIEFQQAKKLETIGRLAGGIAHDFNNMLAGIVGYSEMLLSELHREPRLQGYALSILDTAQRAAKLTSQLLAFSRKGKMVSIPVDIHSRIASSFGLLRSTTDRRISIVTRFKATSATVMGDPTLLESALLNLAVNARDATPVGGLITIETENVHLGKSFIIENALSITPGEYVEITISDTGSGMSDDVKSHLFEPFFTTKGIGRGTGLGLAAVYGTIKEHLGAIKVKSDLNIGTTFSLFLPLSSRSVEEIGNEELYNAKGYGCVLLVDDERIIRETASAMLQALGYEVLVANNGVDAVEIYKREFARIRLVLLDVVMSKLSGPETYFALKNINSDVKIVFSSGYAFDNGAHELLIEGVFGFIQKPFRRNDLYKIIEKTLSPQEFESELAQQA